MPPQKAWLRKPPPLLPLFLGQLLTVIVLLTVIPQNIAAAMLPPFSVCSEKNQSFDLTGDGLEETLFTITALEECPESRLLLVKNPSSEHRYELLLQDARLEDAQVVFLRGDYKKGELLLSWRINGSGGYMGFLLLGFEPEGYRELLRVEGLPRGSLSWKEGYLEQMQALYRPHDPNSCPWALEYTAWSWNGAQFVVKEVVIQENHDLNPEELAEKTNKEHFQSQMSYSLFPPGVEEIIERIARKLDVPPVIIKAIALIESGGRHFRSDGKVITGLSGEIGLMQVYPHPGIYTPHEVERLQELEFNIEAGIRTLIEKKMMSGRLLPLFVHENNPGEINMHDNILETWYFAIWAYNGWLARNNPNNPQIKNPYQTRVMEQVRRLGYAMEGVPALSLPKELLANGEMSFPPPGAGSIFTLPARNKGGLFPLQPGTRAVVNVSRLNVREKPATFFGPLQESVAVLDALFEGEEVLLLEGPHTTTQNRWYRISRPKEETPEPRWAAGSGGFYNDPAVPNRLHFVYYLIRSSYPGLKWPAKFGVSLQHTWTVQFNKPLHLDSMNNQNFYIIDSWGNHLPVFVTEGECSSVVKIIPRQGYLPGTEYILIISESIRSRCGKNLLHGFWMPFTTGQS